MLSRATIGALAATAMLLVAPLARAQDVGDEEAHDDEEARAEFGEARAAMQEARYEDALMHFQRSYELSERPELLYNIGMMHDRLRHDADALDAFRRYLAAYPEAPNRLDVERRIEILESSEADGGASAGPSAGPNVAAIVLTVAGGAVAIAGVVMLAVAAADVASVENAPMNSAWSSVRDAYERSEPLSIAGALALAVGAVGLGVGIVLLATDSGSAEVAVGPGGVSLRGSF
ncbi:MAG: tol-pal system YbgF family protein [Sandaracinaceae bacterium]